MDNSETHCGSLFQMQWVSCDLGLFKREIIVYNKEKLNYSGAVYAYSLQQQASYL